MQTTLKRLKKDRPSKFINSFTPDKISLIIISFGILVRLVQYFFNRSLWNDEAALALNIVNRSYLELLQPLDYNQGAPIGFLMVEKLAVQLLGNNEYALRIFPLISSIASLFLFYHLAKRCLQRSAVPIALILFAGLEYLLYFAAEVKQYSTDVAIAILCGLMGVSLTRKKTPAVQIVTSALVGAIAVWFSHPAIFILAGVGIYHIFLGVQQKDRDRLLKILAITSIWLLSFAGLYFLSLRNLGESAYLLRSWKNKYAFPTAIFDINWSYLRYIKLFKDPLGFPETLVAIPRLVCLAGFISLWDRRKEILLILISPFLMTLLAGYLQKYPFHSRLVLFLTPFFILGIAEGSYFIWQKTCKNRFTAVISILIVGSLLAVPITNASNRLVQPQVRQEIKQVMSYVKTHQRPGDIVYIYQRAEYQFRYYSEKYGYRNGDYIMGIDDLDEYDGKGMSEQEWKRYQNDFDRLRGNQRVWVILSHITHVPKEQQQILSYLDGIGQKIDSFIAPGSFAYLYDFSRKI
jgi:4-amino-4-deoxy-L-arabinose transferase-like glycosyltransferase